MSLQTLLVQDLIEDMAQAGRDRIAEAERQAQAEEEARQEAERRRIAAEWQPHLERIRAALPAWMHPYLQHPTDVEPIIHRLRHHNPVVLSLPSLAPIHVYAYAGNYDSELHFDVPTPSAQYDEFADAGEAWYVHGGRTSAERFEVSQMGTDLAVAVALAQSAAAMLAVAKAEVQRRNAEAVADAVLGDFF